MKKNMNIDWKVSTTSLLALYLSPASSPDLIVSQNLIKVIKFLKRMFCLGGFCPGVFGKGGFCPGGFCPGVFVRGFMSRGFLSGGFLS